MNRTVRANRAAFLGTGTQGPSMGPLLSIASQEIRIEKPKSVYYIASFELLFIGAVTPRKLQTFDIIMLINYVGNKSLY